MCISIINSGIVGRKEYNDNQVSNVRQQLRSDLSEIGDKVCLVDGQASRLAAVENYVKKLNYLFSEHPFINFLPKFVINNTSLLGPSCYSWVF